MRRGEDLRFNTKLSCSLVLLFSLAQGHASAVEGPQNFTGQWIAQANLYGTRIYLRLVLAQTGEKITGTSNGDKLEGSAHGDTIHALVKDGEGGTEELEGTFRNDVISGVFKWIEAGYSAQPKRHPSPQL